MKESYSEDLANHGGPDHALATREGAAKRWTGVRVGGLLSREITVNWGADAVTKGGRQDRRSRFRELPVGPARSENLACTRAPHAENREIRSLPAVVMAGRAAQGRPRP